MSNNNSDGELSSLRHKLFLAENEFQEALKADKPFLVLKEIRLNIKHIKAEIEAKGSHSFSGFQDNNNNTISSNN